MYIPPKSIQRRHFLKGFGGAALSLPFLDAMASTIRPGKKAKPPKRMVCVGTTFGFVPSYFFPSQSGTKYEMPRVMKTLERHRKDLTILSKLDHGASGIGGHRGVHAYLSGITSVNAKSFKEQNISMDQKAAQHVGGVTRYPSMQFTAGSDPNNLMSWTSSGVAIPPIVDLRKIYALLFQSNSKAEVSVLEKAYKEEKSILDLVQQDAKQLQRVVGKEDQETLDQYFTSLRDVEKRLTQSEAWLYRPKPKVSYQVPDDVHEKSFAERIPLYYDLMALALQTDSTRIITLEISDIGRNLGGLPITKGYHTLSHHGKVQALLDELAIVETFHIDQFARFLDKLKACKEADGTNLLDNTMNLIGSGMGNASSHSNKDIPLLLAGGGFKHGQHLSFDKRKGYETPASNLFTSMLQNFGLNIDKFNLASGALKGLEKSS